VSCSCSRSRTLQLALEAAARATKLQGGPNCCPSLLLELQRLSKWLLKPCLPKGANSKCHSSQNVGSSNKNKPRSRKEQAATDWRAKAKLGNNAWPSKSKMPNWMEPDVPGQGAKRKFHTNCGRKLKRRRQRNRHLHLPRSLFAQSTSCSVVISTSRPKPKSEANYKSSTWRSKHFG